MSRLAPRDLRALKILSLLLPTFAVMYSLPSLRDAWVGTRERAAAAVDRLERERVLLADSAAIARATTERSVRLRSLASAVPLHSNLETAQSELLRRLRSVALEQQVAVFELASTASDTLVPGVRRLTAQLRGESDLAGTLGLLRAITRLRVPTRVSRLLLERATPEPNGGVGASDGRNVLRISLQIESLALISQTGPSR